MPLSTADPSRYSLDVHRTSSLITKTARSENVLEAVKKKVGLSFALPLTLKYVCDSQ